MSIKLSPLLSDGMVLQRDAEVTLWGWADEPVAVTFLGQTYCANPDTDGKWSVTLRGLAPGGPHTMAIGSILLCDVYVGDVWLCTGQSNMQFPMRRAKHMYPEELRETQPRIRQFTVAQRTDFHGPRDDLASGRWAGVSPDTIEDFSAVGYFFAKRLFERYGVPIGLILTAIGGTPIHAWMSRGMLEGFPELIEEADRCSDDAYVARVQAEDAEGSRQFMEEIDRADMGLAEGWDAAEYDDRDWEERQLLAPWEGTGSVWLRKEITIPQAMAGRPAVLFLGTLLDADTVYVNGVCVGNTTYRYPPREYAVPPLPAGRCVIAVRVISMSSGGFTPGKQYLLSTEAGAINLNGNWRFHRGGQAAPPQPQTAFHYTPTGLYNGMLAPLRRYAVRGAIWYQGESDANSPDRYAEKFAAMARGWRADWAHEFPILFVELSEWGEGVHWDALRAQQWLALDVPKTAMAASYDLGEHNDLHPQSKQAVGDRLARCAMRVAYGERMPPSPFELV